MLLEYFLVLILMILESTFIPFPSEIVMIPAGYLAATGDLNIFIVIALGIIGSVIGALINYYIADKFGREFLHKNAKRLFTTKEKLIKVEKFFKKHGAFSTFFGRLLPLIRQFISFPAGLSKMNFKKFILYTSLGAGLWVTILSLLGYFIGENTVLIDLYLHKLTLLVIAITIIIAIIYFCIVYKDKLKKIFQKKQV